MGDVDPPYCHRGSGHPVPTRCRILRSAGTVFIGKTGIGTLFFIGETGIPHRGIDPIPALPGLPLPPEPPMGGGDPALCPTPERGIRRPPGEILKAPNPMAGFRGSRARKAGESPGEPPLRKPRALAAALLLPLAALCAARSPAAPGRPRYPDPAPPPPPPRARCGRLPGCPPPLPPPLRPAGARLLGASAARAGGPVTPPVGPDPMQEIKEASLRISKALKENEEALTKPVRGEKGDPKPVDIQLPPKDGSPPPPQDQGSSGGEGKEGEALRKSAEQGKEVVDGINKIIETAGKLGGQRRSPGSSGGEIPPSGGKDPKDPSNGKKEQEKRKDPLKDNKPEDGQKPDSPEKPKNPQDTKGVMPPDSPKKNPPPPKDSKNVFLARLPDKVREAIENGDFDQIPEKYRDLIREWTKALSEQDKKESGAAEGR